MLIISGKEICYEKVICKCAYERQNKNQAVWYLGESIKKLSQADVFIGICESYDWNGCQIERETAVDYGIKAYAVPARYVIQNHDALLNKVNQCVPKVSVTL